MKIPFTKIVSPNLIDFNQRFQKSIDVGHYTNFGPNEKELTFLLEEKIERSVVCVANATLALDGIHHILSNQCEAAHLPGFTFPATNLGCRIDYKFGETQIDNNLLGFTTYSRSTINDYCITTSPFGTNKPISYSRPNCKYWIVDNAAGTSPKMEKAKEWLDCGADVVICSLHATKILSGCEGGFVVFNNKDLYQQYRKYITFGFYLDAGEKKMIDFGSNHKMSELSASYVLSYYYCNFNNEYNQRLFVVDKYKQFCEDNNIKYIYSPQAFWILCKTNAEIIEKQLLKFDIESRPYYKPLWKEDIIDSNAIELSKRGLVLPTWGMNEDEIEYVINKLKEVNFKSNE